MNKIQNKDIYEQLLESLKKIYLEKNNIYLNSNINIKFNYEFSSINRQIKIINIMNSLEIDKTKMICTTLKIIRNNKVLNYSYIYGNINNKDINNKYILNSTSLVSKDGEYRHRLINYNIIDLFIKNNSYNYFYKYLSNEYKNKEFLLDFHIFNLYDETILDKYKKKLHNSNILLNLYLISWITEIFNIYQKNQEININENSNNILFSNKDIDIFTNFYKDNNEEINSLIKELTYFNINNKLELGQKLIPFNYIQLKDYKNIIHPQWKELLINKIILNLIYNNNSPCFPIFGYWFLITNSNKELFNNDIIFDKLNYSEKIKDILNYLYFAKNNLIDLNKTNDNKLIISNLLKRLKKIISLSEDNILMSNVSLCFLSEYSGKTIYDYYNKISLNININNNIGNLLSDYDIFKKYIFEIIYSLYCLNLKGIIHGDLHLNNITFNIQKYNTINNYILYNINDKNYIFKHYGTFPCIIDFSRSYIFLTSIDENIIEKEKNKIRIKFIKNEKKRIINELNKIFPNYIKNNIHKIKFLFKNTNFETLFIYFSAYDTFTFITNLLIFLKRISIHNNANINPDIIELLNKISKKAYFYMEQIIIEENYQSNTKHEFPNLLLIEEFFTDNIINNTLKYNVDDIFGINNIKNYMTIKELKKNIYDIIKNNLNKSYNLDVYNNLIKDNKLEELEIEKIINNEYYKVKSNLLLATETVNTSSFVETTNSLSLSNI